jgi:hypothetical protein
VPPDHLARLAWVGAALRAEDWLLVGWVAFAGPLLGQIEGSAGPFDPGRPIEGALRLLAVLGALVCLATGRSDAPTGAGAGVLERASVGPLVGGLLLVALSGASGLGLAGGPGYAVLVGAVIVIVAVRIRWPALPTTVRRALVTPFVLVTGGIFWSIVDAVTAGGSWRGTTAGGDLQGIALVLGVLVAFSGIYYAMLIYAPRQVAEAEGGLATWLVRYCLFLASIIVGVAWLRPLGI